MTKPLYKPNQHVRVQMDGYAYIGEAMSFPTPEGTLMVRRVIGHPGTLEEIPLDKVSPAEKHKFVHYAAVAGSKYSSFPVDMLRYDMAAPVNFKLIEEDGRVRTEIDPSFGFEELVVATCTTNRRATAWCKERWSSFLWGLREIKTEAL